MLIATLFVSGAPSVGQPNEPAVLQYGESKPAMMHSAMIPGIVRPVRDVTAGAPLDGRLSIVHVDEGQRVKRGDVIAELDSSVAQAAAAAARAAAEREAGVDMSRAELDLAKRTLGRLEASRERGGAGPIQIDEARTAVLKAEASLASAIEQQRVAVRNHELEEAKVEQHRIRAPFDGIVVRIHVQEGQMLSQGAPMVRIIDLSELRVDLYLPAEMFGQMQCGDVYRLGLGAPIEEERPASIHSVEPVVDSASRTFRVVFDIPNADGAIPAGVRALPMMKGGVIASPIARMP